MAAAADKNFMWSDEEINLLLHVVIDYKAGKAGGGVDWESVRSKYEDVTKMFLENTLMTTNTYPCLSWLSGP